VKRDTQSIQLLSPDDYEEKSKGFISRLVEEKPEIIVFGSQNMGVVMHGVLNKLGLSVTCFCDNTPPEPKTCYGLPCLTPAEAVDKHPDAVYVLSALEPSTCYKMKEQLVGLSADAAYCNWDIVYYAFVASKRNVDKAAFSNALWSFWGQKRDETLTISSVSLRITSRCNLRCNGCLFLVPEQPKLHDYPLDELITSLKALCDMLDGILDLTINGGETFMYSELGALLEAIACIPKVINVIIATNGTIVPSDAVLKICADNAFRIRISNYGSITGVKDKIHKKCKDFGVAVYNYRFVEKWCDFGTTKHNRTDEENRVVADTCPYNDGKNYRGLGIYRKKVNLCDRFDGLFACGYIKDDEHEGLLFDLETGNREALKKFLQGESLYKQCDMCNWPMGEIISGEQLLGGK
jgi:hypothetical protein